MAMIDFRDEDLIKWVAPTDFQLSNPLSCKVESVFFDKGTYIVVFYANELNDKRKCGLWKVQLGQFVNKLGRESDNWKGKQFKLFYHIDPATKKTVRTFEVF